MTGCLLIHGFTGGPHEINPLYEYLSKKTDWELEIPTLRGHGEELDLDDASFMDWINGSKKALKKLERTCTTIYVIGFSMGGMIAAYLAATERVDKLVLLAPARKYLSLKYLSKDIVEMIKDGLTGKINENETYLQTVNKLGDVPLKANIEFVRLVHYTKGYLGEIDIPVFIAQGKQDEMVPYYTAYSLEEEIKSNKKEIVFFAESDHLICLGENKDVLNELVLNFLRKEVVPTISYNK